MDYQDAQLEFAEFSVVAGRLVEKMRRFQPDVVVTFGGDGGLNTHPDHMMVSMLITAAFHWAGQRKRYPEIGQPYRPKKLYHLTTNFFMPDRESPMPIPWTLTLDIHSVRERKSEAFRQHISQAPLMERTKELFEKYGGEEFYALIATAEPQATRTTTDLFDDLS
jgi:LmbE family N-acetylglucosaminyl deacetylase